MLICRKGSRLGHDSLVDGMLKDGLWDVYTNSGMGTCAELCADKYQITREAQVLIVMHFEFVIFLFYFVNFSHLWISCRMTSLSRALSEVLLPRTAVPLNGKLFRLDIPPYHCIANSLVENYKSYVYLNLQVEVSGGRGKPSTIVNSDEGLGKVFTYHPFM